jgi:hypothetical protein
MNDKIRQLRREIELEEGRIDKCKHSFTEPIYDPESVMEGYGSVQDGAGSDPHWGYEGYHSVQKDRWSRTCITCGKKEFTNKQEAIITTKYKPKF